MAESCSKSAVSGQDGVALQVCSAPSCSVTCSRVVDYDLSEIKYVPKEESVYLVYHGSCNFKKKINIECCSGFGIVKAVINSL